MLFAYPRSAAVGRVIAKSKIYQHTRISAPLREKFVAEVQRIVWEYKLSPETINLPADATVPEIQIFKLELRADTLGEEVLRAIDRAIPFPIVFELHLNGRIQLAAAPKRPNAADPSKWFLDTYFRSGWYRDGSKRVSLPVALDLGTLYSALLRSLIQVPARPGEKLNEHLERVAAIETKRREARRLAQRLRREKQFNRKVELNRALRELNLAISALGGS